MRQSAWLAAATIVGSAFMTLVHPFAASLKGEEYAAYGTMLRALLLFAIPSIGLQIAFAQRAAAATPETEPALAAATRKVLGVITLLWAALVLVTAVFYRDVVALFKLGDGKILWPTLAAAWVSLVVPVFRGLLQGRQQFVAFGISAVVDGAFRLAGVAVLVALLQGQAASAMTAALVAMLVATGVVAWASRAVWLGPGSGFAWGPFLRQVFPFSIGAGCMMILSQVDLIYLKAAIPAELEDKFRLSYLYQPAAMIGFAMTQFTVPIAAVMFPKIARSVARAERTDAFTLALIGTVVLGSLAALAATVFPELPLRILFFRTPANWAAAPMVPWCAWAMLAFAVTNVLVSHLLAREDFRIVPGAVVLTLAFLGTLWWLKPRLPGMEPFAAYRLVIGTVGGFNLALLALAASVTRTAKKTLAATSPSAL